MTEKEKQIALIAMEFQRQLGTGTLSQTAILHRMDEFMDTHESSDEDIFEKVKKYCEPKNESYTWYKAYRTNPDGTTQVIENDFENENEAITYAKINSCAVDKWTYEGCLGLIADFSPKCDNCRTVNGTKHIADKEFVPALSDLASDLWIKSAIRQGHEVLCEACYKSLCCNHLKSYIQVSDTFEIEQLPSLNEVRDKEHIWYYQEQVDKRFNAFYTDEETDRFGFPKTIWGKVSQSSKRFYLLKKGDIQFYHENITGK